MRRNWSSPEAEAAGGRHPPLLPSAGWTEIDAGGAAGELARRRELRPRRQTGRLTWAQIVRGESMRSRTPAPGPALALCSRPPGAHDGGGANT